MIERKDLRYKRLEPADDLSKFCCSVDDPLHIDTFIHEKALKHQEDGKGVTTLFYHVLDESHKTLVGFITMRGWNALRPTSQSSDKSLEGLSSIMISNLGVDNHYRLDKIGSQIFWWGVRQAEKMNTCCAFPVVVWESTTELAESFYKNKAAGVIRLKKAADGITDLRLMYVRTPKFTSNVKLNVLP